MLVESKAIAITEALTNEHNGNGWLLMNAFHELELFKANSESEGIPGII